MAVCQVCFTNKVPDPGFTCPECRSYAEHHGFSEDLEEDAVLLWDEVDPEDED